MGLTHYRIHNRLKLFRSKLGVHRQANAFRGHLFGYRKRSVWNIGVLVSWLEVQGHRIVNARGDTLAFEPLLKSFAIRNPHHKQVPDRRGIGMDRLRADSAVSQSIEIEICVAPAGVGPFIEMTELHAQNGGLQAIKPAVPPLHPWR